MYYRKAQDMNTLFYP